MKKICLILQCYNGDKAIAMELARLIADLEEGVCPYADFMFVFRHDTEIDQETVQYVARKFASVYTFKNIRKTSGWPQGCNDLFFESYIHFCLKIKRGEWDYAAALFFESDCVPLYSDWISQLYHEWNQQNKLILGYVYGENEHPYPHVNGNLIISPEFYKKNPQFYACSGIKGWDVAHARTMIKHATESRLIYNDYSRQEIAFLELFSKKWRPKLGWIYPVFYHGVKGRSALQHVKEKFKMVER
jgi:hypothetical protein